MTSQSHNPADPSTPDLRAFVHEDALEHFADCFRKHVGRGKLWSVEGLAERMAMSADTVKGWHIGRATPGMFLLLRLLSVMPVEFADELLAPAGLVIGRRASGNTATMACAIACSDAAAQLARIAEDGKITHVEIAETRPVIEAAATACQGWLANTRPGPVLVEVKSA